jgi:hypothetical protein
MVGRIRFVVFAIMSFLHFKMGVARVVLKNPTVTEKRNGSWLVVWLAVN